MGSDAATTIIVLCSPSTPSRVLDNATSSGISRFLSTVRASGPKAVPSQPRDCPREHHEGQLGEALCALRLDDAGTDSYKTDSDQQYNRQQDREKTSAFNGWRAVFTSPPPHQ